VRQFVNNLYFLFILTTNIYSCQTITNQKLTAENLLLPEALTLSSLAFPNVITPNQASEDVNFLIYALSNAYGGRKYVDQRLLQKAISDLSALPLSRLTLSEFHDKIDEALFAIPDNHLRAYYQGKVSLKRQNYEIQNVGQVGKNRITDINKVWEVQVDRVSKQKILLIALTKFPPHENKIWQNFLASITEKFNLVDKIVIDLRGNSGGDDTIGMELAGVLYGHSFEHPIKRQYRSQTPETVALLTNRFNIEIFNLKYDNQIIPEYLVKDLSDSKARFQKALKGEIQAEFIRSDKGLNRSESEGFNKPIYILMDKECGSSCEFTIAALEAHAQMKKVGENTSGTFHFSNSGIAVLPNSKIKVMVPSQFSEYYDKRFFERIGIAPDIKVPPGEDAYSFLKKII